MLARYVFLRFSMASIRLVLLLSISSFGCCDSLVCYKGIKNEGHVGPQHATLRYLRSYGKLPPVIPMSFPLRPGGLRIRRILEWIYPHLPAVLGELSIASPY